MRKVGTSAEARARSAFLLQVPIQVRTQFAGDAPINEETTTLQNQRHGGLIALAMRVHADQKNSYLRKLRATAEGAGMPVVPWVRDKTHRQK